MMISWLSRFCMTRTLLIFVLWKSSFVERWKTHSHNARGTHRTATCEKSSDRDCFPLSSHHRFSAHMHRICTWPTTIVEPLQSYWKNEKTLI